MRRGGSREATAADFKTDGYGELEQTAATVSADREPHDFRARDTDARVAQQGTRQPRTQSPRPPAEGRVLGVRDQVDLVVATDDRALRREVVRRGVQVTGGRL